MKRLAVMIFIIVSLLLTGCAENPAPADLPDQTVKATVQDITPEEAKTRLDSEEEIILLDVRTQEEFDQGHIADALLLPVDQLSAKASEVIPDLEAVYFVYCRSGSRSGAAAAMMVEMGYQNVFDLGGILDWPYETVKRW